MTISDFCLAEVRKNWINNFHYMIIFIANFCGNINPKKKDGSTPLHKAAKNGHLEVCQYILPNVMVKNPKGRRGETLLHTVAKAHKSTYSKNRDKKIQFEVYKCIAESVEDKNPPDKYGITPLHIATNSIKQQTYRTLRLFLSLLKVSVMVARTFRGIAVHIHGNNASLPCKPKKR